MASNSLKSRHCRVYNADHIQLHSCDVSDRSAVAALASAVEAEWGAVNVLVNNAGINTKPRSSSPRCLPAPVCLSW